MRGERGSSFVEVGQYASIADAAEAILKTEGKGDFAYPLHESVYSTALAG